MCGRSTLGQIIGLMGWANHWVNGLGNHWVNALMGWVGASYGYVSKQARVSKPDSRIENRRASYKNARGGECPPTSIYIYIYIHTCILYTHMHAHTHACMHVYPHTYTRTYIRTYIHTYMHTCTHALFCVVMVTAFASRFRPMMRVSFCQGSG